MTSSAITQASHLDLLNAVPTETKKTYGIDKDGPYIWGQLREDRKYLTKEEQERGLPFVGPIRLEIVTHNPYNQEKSYLVWHYNEPQSDQTLEPVMFKFACNGNYNETEQCKLIQHGPAYLIAQLLQLCKNNVQMQDISGKLCPSPGNQVVFTPLFIYAKGKLRKVPIQWERSYDRLPHIFEERISEICRYLGQSSIFPQKVNDSTTDYQEDD
jgi:hypothetical protein